ncbi:anti-sigma factor [Mucilaginibacter lacusdianchii]|uniref:anti-sigma factor n=1 Tax=Mucilaginibacter lacusdianchii TaxID=2684211 RepID=UPI00131E8858|nr:anti-sigma factor [Mucilaginibacter sp. JXJ CY 39]
MEDIKAYIESGVLELYVLGDLSAEERADVEAMALKYPEVKAELQDIEQAAQLYADVHDIETGDDLRNRVLNSLMTNLGDDRNFTKGHYGQPETPVHSITGQATPTTSVFYKYAFAASLLLLCLCGGALAIVSKRLQSANQQLVTYQLQNQKFSKQVKYMDQEISVFRDPSFQFIKLKGNTSSNSLTVAWSPKRKKVMVDMTSAALPATDKNHQYQLWAIANGKPVDLGMIDATKADSADMMEMKPAEQAQAFAVTLEPKGGSAKPTTPPLVIASL